MAIASDKMVFYYMARDNLCFLTLCEDAYPKRLAFLYLEEIADIILNELQREYGTNVSYYMFKILSFDESLFKKANVLKRSENLHFNYVPI
jgi:hypothetical protein